MSEPRRAQSIEELRERLSRFASEESLRHALSFRPRPSDVIIATYPKAGTTWMQQIVHGLRTRGDMDFEEITEVVPWIELAFDLGWDLQGDQRASPRVYKSHWNGVQVPEGCRYLCVLRDPRDTMVAFYHFMNGWFLEKDSVTLDDFTRYITFRAHPSGDYWSHLLSWWHRRHEACVLVVTFEDLQEDLEREVRRVVSFLELDVDEATIQVALRQASFDFMKAHESQFDEHLTASARNAACLLPATARSTKVRTGRVGGYRGAFRPETLELLEERWYDVIEAETRLPDYAALRAALHRERADAAGRPCSDPSPTGRLV